MTWQSSIANILLFLGVLLISYDLHVLQELKNSGVKGEVQVQGRRRVAWIDGHGEDPLNGYMKHIKEAFQYFGYEIITGDQEEEIEWDVMWIHDYSITKQKYRKFIDSAGTNQLINHVPGSGYYTSKVSLATAGLSKGVPEAFQLPKEKEKFLEYAEANKDVMWVQKDNSHRNIKIFAVDEVDLEKSDSFVQKFVDNPLLIDNRKFDIGVYVVVTSLLPLRVYIYNGDALLRFCPKDYYPFDVSDVDKYVVGDDYTPIWEIPSLFPFYNNQKLGRRDSLDAYLTSKGMEPFKIWSQIGEIIAEVFNKRQANMLAALKGMNMKPRYFELSRFDFVVDDELNVYLMEANMSPNLSSGHFLQNQILYEQVLYNVLSLIGAANALTKDAQLELSTRPEEFNLLATDRQLRLPLPYCGNSCTNCDEKPECQLCGHCMTTGTELFLREAILEHNRRQSMVLVRRNSQDNLNFSTKEDFLFNLWLKAKCEFDYEWC